MLTTHCTHLSDGAPVENIDSETLDYWQTGTVGSPTYSDGKLIVHIDGDWSRGAVVHHSSIRPIK